MHINTQRGFALKFNVVLQQSLFDNCENCGWQLWEDHSVCYNWRHLSWIMSSI